MPKKHSILLLIIFLMIILIPTTFAMENDTLTVQEESFNDVMSVDESNDIEMEPSSGEIHVDINGNDNNTGFAGSPVSTIKKAINISSENSKIIIHEGIYRENNLNITKSLEIRGEGNVIIDAEDTSRIFTINTGVNDKVLLSGITFSNGRAYQGGAIFVRNAQTTINGSRFVNNTALTEGGAIYWNSDNGRLTNTIFENNFARDGSAVSWGGIESTFTGGDYGEIVNCTFNENYLLLENDSCVGLSIYSNRMKVINSTFSNHNLIFNSSFGVLYINGDYATVIGCRFINNSMTLAGVLGFDGNYAIAHNNVFINNTLSLNGSFGGAIGIQSETATIYNNTFISNGGENAVGGAIFINTVETFQFSFINITDNIFTDNKAEKGGAIYTIGKTNMLSLLIENNTFDKNKAINGAGVYIVDVYNPVTIKNNKFKNLVAESGSGIYSNACILVSSNNLMENCSSNDADIYYSGEIQSKLNLKFNDAGAVFGQPVTLTAALTDEMGNTIATKKIKFIVNNETLKGNGGINSITTTFNGIGNYTITGSLEDGANIIENGTLKIIHYAKLNVNEVVYGKNPQIGFGLIDEAGNNLSGFKVIFTVNGNNLLVTTNASGMGLIKSNLNHGTYNITSRLYNQDNYQIVNDTFTINVLSSIESSNMNRAYNSGTDFKAILYDSDGYLLANIEVDLNVNGKHYKVITNSKGEAILNVKLSVGTYNVVVDNPLTGDSNSNTLKISKRITGNANINMFYLANKYYKVRVFDDDGKAVGAVQIVKMTIGGKKYNVKTDKNGYASFKITLKPKTYTITATYKGVKVSNKVVVKPVLTAKNISKKMSKIVKFSAKLVNTNGKALKGKTLIFKFKGKTYRVSTNAKGIATVSLKDLKVGNYKIVTKYGKTTLTNTIKIKK